MFRKATFLTALVMTVLTCGWLFHLVYLSSADRVHYKAMIKSGKAIARASKDKQTHQHRSGVRKDLWLAQEDKTRLHHRIDSKSSVLTLLPIDDKVDIIENLEQIQCWMQDRLYTQEDTKTAMQQMRFFEADTGIYQYSSQKFSASTVALSLFRLPGAALPTALDPKTAFLRGIAQDVSFSIAGKATQFQAQKFKATIGEKP